MERDSLRKRRFQFKRALSRLAFMAYAATFLMIAVSKGFGATSTNPDPVELPGDHPYTIKVDDEKRVGQSTVKNHYEYQLKITGTVYTVSVINPSVIASVKKLARVGVLGPSGSIVDGNGKILGQFDYSSLYPASSAENKDKKPNILVPPPLNGSSTKDFVLTKGGPNKTEAPLAVRKVTPEAGFQKAALAIVEHPPPEKRNRPEIKKDHEEEKSTPLVASMKPPHSMIWMAAMGAFVVTGGAFLSNGTQMKKGGALPWQPPPSTPVADLFGDQEQTKKENSLSSHQAVSDASHTQSRRALNSWRNASKRVCARLTKSVPRLIVGVATGSGVRIGMHYLAAKFMLAATAMAAPLGIAVILSGFVVGALVGAISNLVTTWLFGREEKENIHWVRKAFLRGALHGGIGGGIGAGVTDWLISGHHLDALSQNAHTFSSVPDVAAPPSASLVSADHSLSHTVGVAALVPLVAPTEMTSPSTDVGGILPHLVDSTLKSPVAPILFREEGLFDFAHGPHRSSALQNGSLGLIKAGLKIA